MFNLWLRRLNILYYILNDLIDSKYLHPKVPKGPSGTLRSKVSKRYLKVQGIQEVPKAPGFFFGGGADRQTDTQTYPHTQEPGRVRQKKTIYGNTTIRNTQILIKGTHNYNLQINQSIIYRNTKYRNTEIQIAEVQKHKVQYYKLQ